MVFFPFMCRLAISSLSSGKLDEYLTRNMPFLKKIFTGKVSLSGCLLVLGMLSLKNNCGADLIIYPPKSVVHKKKNHHQIVKLGKCLLLTITRKQQYMQKRSDHISQVPFSTPTNLLIHFAKGVVPRFPICHSRKQAG